VKHAVKKDGSLRPLSVGHRQLKNQTISCQKLVPSLQKTLCGGIIGIPGAKGDKGSSGTPGTPGTPGVKGDAGDRGAVGPDGAIGPRGDGTIIVTPDTPGVCYTNPSVNLTPDGVVFGPYQSNEQGGSVCINPGEGVTLADVAHLAYTASFSATTDNGDAPYLRIFTNDGTNDHDVLFAPSTQPGGCVAYAATDALVVPVPPHSIQCASRGRMIEYHVDQGTVRYDDDPGAGPDDRWSAVINAHGSEVVTGIYVTSGFSQPDTTGAVLNSISYEVAGLTPTTLAFAS
jgi:hypothetical protein